MSRFVRRRCPSPSPTATRNSSCVLGGCGAMLTTTGASTAAMYFACLLILFFFGRQVVQEKFENFQAFKTRFKNRQGFAPPWVSDDAVAEWYDHLHQGQAQMADIVLIADFVLACVTTRTHARTHTRTHARAHARTHKARHIAIMDHMTMIC